MDEIGKLLFNALASRKPIRLPEIGTFRTEFNPAKENPDGSVAAPRNEVVFCPEQQEDAVSVTELMGQEPGGESPAARYDRWLVKATERGPAVIEGIGVVNNGVFTPYESLLNALNPIPAAAGAATKPAANKGMSRSEKRWLVFIVICVLILAGGWSWWHYTDGQPFGQNKWNAKNPAVTDNLDRIPEPTGTVEGVVETNPAEEVDGGEVEIPAPQPATTPAGSAPAGFYVVGNVFTIPENADKYINDMKKKYPDLDYRKHPLKGDRVLVSLYHSTDRADANRQRRKIEDKILNFELWLYEVN